MTPELEYCWRGDIKDAELVALTKSYGGSAEAGWWDRIRPYSLGWVTARLGNGAAAGLVNAAWDGRDHAFLIDTKVRSDLQRQGVGTELVRIAMEQAKRGGLRMAADTIMPRCYGDPLELDWAVAGLCEARRRASS